VASVPVSEAKSKNNAKWDKENMIKLSTAARKEDAEAFRAWAKSQGLSVHAALLAYVFEKIGKSRRQ
jgi:hypothetical protein